MNDKFDELTKGLAQSVTRRGALKKFGAGVAGLVLALVGLPSDAKGDPGHCKRRGQKCQRDYECCSGYCHTTAKRAGYCL